MLQVLIRQRKLPRSLKRDTIQIMTMKAGAAWNGGQRERRVPLILVRGMGPGEMIGALEQLSETDTWPQILSRRMGQRAFYLG